MSTKVLVFESDAAFASELRNELGKLGCSTQIVDDGNVGLQQAAADRPDLILLSIELPRMNGFSVCNKLKKDPALKDVPLIIMSSESSDETFEQHRKLRTRAEDYVHKPIAFGELLQHIQSFVRIDASGQGGSQSPAEHRPSEGAIVIDDEISLATADMEDEGTQIGNRPDFPMSPPVKTGNVDVDADVDAFTDAAFGMLTGAPPPLAAAAADAPAAREPMNGGRGDLQRPPTLTSASRPMGSPPRERPSVPSLSSTGAHAIGGAGVGSGGAEMRPRMPSMPPPLRPALDNAELERLRADLEKARARGAELEKEISTAKDDATRLREEADRASRSDTEAQRMQRDIDELKAKLATAQRGTGGVSSREFLDLREALNKKDKEILNLREQLGKKDKEILDNQEKTIALERLKAELDDKNLAGDRELADARDKIDALQADKDQAKKVSEDFKGRHARAQAEVETRTKEIGELRARSQEETAAHEMALAALRGDMQQAVEKERDERTAATAQLAADRARDAEEAKKALDLAIEAATKEKSDALAARERDLRQETDTKLAALHRAHQEELTRTRADLGRQVEAATSKAAADVAAAEQRRTEHVSQVERDAAAKLAEREAALDALRAGEVSALAAERDERLSSMEREHGARMDAEAREHAEKLAALESDRDERLTRTKREADERVSAVENDRDARIAGVESKAARELADARALAEASSAAASEQIAGLERELRDARQQLASAEQARAASDAANGARIAELDERLARVTAERDDVQRAREATEHTLGEAADRIATLEREAERTRGELEETRARVASETTRANRAYSKWESDKTSLDRAKDALAVALQQIEEAEART
jgi:DNA-binding response OmpR family regulator/chromosome segregation ATPase